jgi:Methylamine utilisation protein MauE
MTEALLADPLAGWIASAWLAVLFAHAAVAKWGDLALFEQHLAAYHLPDGLRALLLRVLPLLELATAAALLSPWRVAGAALAATLLLAYGAAMAWHLAQGLALDCGCGGEPLPVSWALVARNAALAALALPAAAPHAERALGLGDFAVVAASVPLAALLYAAFNELLRHQVGARMRRI